MPLLRSLALGALLVTVRLSAAGPAPDVTTTTPHRADIHRFVTLPGTLRANQEVTLDAKVAGYLKSIDVDIGDTVKAGQVVAELEQPELVAQRTRHEAEVKIAQLDVDRMKAARGKAPDLITPQAADTADARLAMAQAALSENETLLRYSRLVAPFAGVVTRRYVDIGAFVPAATAGSGPNGAAIVTIADYSILRARVAVPENEAARVRVGEPVVITTEALPGRTFNAVVSRQAGALDEASRTLLVEADLPNPDGALRPGMYASIKLGVEEHRGVLLVPAAALVREGAAGYVFTAVDGKAVRVPVKYGFNDGHDVEITDGLNENSRVLVPGKTPLVAGQAVSVTEAK